MTILPSSALALLALGGLQERAGAPEEATEVRGRVLLEDGTPAPETTVYLDVRPLDGSVGEPAPLVAATDERGWFRIELEPPEHALFTLSLHRAGHVEESWRWTDLARGELLDLGELDLRRAGTLRGRVLSADGRPIPGGWSLTTEPLEVPAVPPRGPRHVEVRGYFEASGAEDSFLLEGLPPGDCRLALDLDAAGRVEGPTATVVAGEETQVDVVYDGPDLARRIHVELTVRPVYPAFPALENVRLHGPEGVLRLPHPGDRARRSLDFDGLDPEGRYTLEIDDPDFEPFVAAELSPGNRRVAVTLTGNVALDLLVEDGESGEVFEDYDLFLYLGEEAFPATEDPWLALEESESPVRAGRVLLKGAGAEPLVRGRLAGLVPGDHLLVVRAEGRAPAHVPLRGLEPGEVRAVHVVLFAGGRVAGHVVEQDGRPRPGARLSLFAPGDEERPPLGRMPSPALPEATLGQGHERALGVAQVDGAFELSPVEPGTYVLRVRSPDGRTRLVRDVVVRNREVTETEVELEPRG